MKKYHLINNTYQVVDNDSVLFQGSEVDCNIFMLQNDISEKYNALENNKYEVPELSDEEIHKEMEQHMRIHSPYPLGKQSDVDWKNGFERGVKWYREQLKQIQ